MSTPKDPTEQKNVKSGVQHIMLSDNRSKRVVSVNDILWLQAVKVYTVYHLRGGSQFIVCKHLKIAFGELPPSMFFRIHRSAVVNLNEIAEYLNARGGKVVLSDNSIVEVSQRNRTEFLNAYVTSRNA
jgi:two-component system LytT family response regulator